MNQTETQVIQILEASTQKKSLPDKGDGWVNLATLGLDLRNNGIDYSALGYDKLRSFIESINGLELYKDERNALPVIYVKVIDKSSRQRSSIAKQNLAKNKARNELMSWAYLGYFPKTIQKLKDMALEEDWGMVQNEKNENIYPVLNSYLQYTYYKLTMEGNKIILSKDKEYAVFNTGLVDSRYKEIYALFKKNKSPNHSQDWYLVDFCIEGEEKAGKTLVQQFTEMPAAAHYFNEVSDMLYDTKVEKPKLDSQHIIIERVDRLPYEFIKASAPKEFEVKDPVCMFGEEKEEYFKNLREAIKNDGSAYRLMTNRLDDALDTAIKRVKWNFKSAIPMYYPEKNEMCLFLPLCLVKDNQVDVALVVEKTPSGRYLGVTIYELSWAYKCARLVCRPDSDWLTIAATKKDQENMLE